MSFRFDRIDTNRLSEELIDFRRDLHKYPESGWTEFRTTVKIIEKLTELGVPFSFGRDIHSADDMYGVPSKQYLAFCEERARKECGRDELIDKMSGGFTGCVAVIEGAAPGPVVAFRVDIDSNDVAESRDEEHIPIKLGFASCHDDLMHACGHDGHAAIGIGAIKLLMKYRDSLAGKVIFIFQPAEEGLRGARSIAEAGILDDVDYIIGGHLGLGLDRLGAIATGSHGFLASTKFDAHFKGIPSHAGAAPELGHNAVAAAACATLNLLAIPRHGGGSSRINVGTMRGGTGRNVIPEYAELTIETRGLTTEINEYMEKSAQRVCRAAADMYECEYSSSFMGSAQTAVCDRELVDRAASAAGELETVKEITEDFNFGGGEDFTTMMNRVQSHGGKATEMVIGTPLAGAHHNGRFDFDEGALLIGAEVFARIALDICK